MRRVLYILLLAPVAYLVLQQPLALYTVVSGSMEPYVPRGSLVVVIPEYPGLGDVGAYRLEEGGKTYVIVHRVVGLGDGFYAFKGDAVEGVEQVPMDRVIGSVVLAIPYVGYVYMAGFANPLLVLLIFLAAFLPSSKPSTLFPFALATGVLAYLSPGRGLTAVVNPLLYLMYSTAFSLFVYFVERREGPHRLISMSYLALAVANAFSIDPRGVASRAWIALAVVAVVMAAFTFVPASGERTYLVYSNFPVKALVNGVEKVVPASAGYGDRVCVPETVYLDEGARIVFRGWDGGGRDLCVTVSGNLTATYAREYLVHVYAQPPALRRSEWVEEGSFLKLDYPAVYNESDGVRWVFQIWSGGETPFQPSNRVYVTKPMRLEAQYVKEFRLLAVATHNVKVNGSGWYREGALAVVAGPKEVYIGNQTRLTLVEWVSAGSTPAIVISQSSPGVAVLEVRGPHIALAKYRAEHYVGVKGPQGVIYAGWVGEGDELKLTAPQHIQLGQDVRLRFAGWSGLEKIHTPELKIGVLGPHNIEAVYIRQYLLTLNSPVGAVGSGWYDEGSKALITAPENPPANIFVKRRLTGFTGDCDDCTYNNGRMVLTMDRPRTITAAYTSEPDIVNLSILAGVVAAGGMVYAAGKRGPKVEKDNENKKLKLTTCDVCGSKIPADATFCPYCGVGLVEVEPQAVDTSE